MKIKKIVAALSLFSFLVAMNSLAAAEIENFDVNVAAQNAVTRSDHVAVAKYYEDVARKMQAKVEEQKLLLAQYEDRSYLYGREAQDLQAHTYALVLKYEKEAKANVKEAALHRQMALKLEDDIYSASNMRKLSRISETHKPLFHKSDG
jgi:hypothetical protein